MAAVSVLAAFVCLNAASAVHDLLVKTHPADREKIELTRRLVSEHLDIDRVLDVFHEPRHPTRRPSPARDAVAGPAGQIVKLVGSGLRGLGRRAAGSRSGAPKGT